MKTATNVFAITTEATVNIFTCTVSLDTHVHNDNDTLGLLGVPKKAYSHPFVVAPSLVFQVTLSHAQRLLKAAS